jgi:hypothetical protein
MNGCQRLLAAGALLVAAFVSGPAAAFDGWHLDQVTTVPSKGSSWDYLSVDEANQRLFIGHRKEGLRVFDLKSNKVVKVIDHTVAESSNGATLLPEFDLGISNNQDGSITPFKLSTLEAMQPIKLGKELDTSHYDPVTKRLVFNMAPGESGSDLIVMQVPSLQVVGKINVPTRKPEHAESDGKGNFFLTARDLDTVYRLDIQNLKVTATWPVPECGQTNGLAMDAESNRLFIGCRGRGSKPPMFLVLDSTNGKTVYSETVGAGNDGVIYDRDLKRIFLANGAHAVMNVFEQVDADHYKQAEALGTRANVRTFAMDSRSKKIYSFAAEGSADYAKKVLTEITPFYSNTFFPDTFAVLRFSK